MGVDDVRTATISDIEVVATIAAAGFFDDPIFTWVFPDAKTRRHKLHAMFSGLARDYFPSRGTVHVLDDTAVAFWREPGFDPAAPRDDGEAILEVPEAPSEEIPFSGDELERLGAMVTAMDENHPHDRDHWYLNVLTTSPERQGRGLGGQLLSRVLRDCDADGLPAFLESSNPRNMSLYRRHGFEEVGEVRIADGAPCMYPMWREPKVTR